MKQGHIGDHRAQIISVGEVSGGAFEALLLAPDLARAARPMQFVEVAVGNGTDPFLRRPFGLSLIDPEAGLVGIIWSVVGRGTAMMAKWTPGETVQVLGPLGNGFDLDRGPLPKTFWLIGGGTGIVPMYPLAKELRERGVEVCLFHGAQTSERLLDTSRFADLGCAIYLATEDGSAGFEGYVTVAIDELLDMEVAVATLGEDACEAVAESDSSVVAVACGPTPMMEAVVTQLLGTGIKLYLSLEERMACGFGLCRGCAVKAADPAKGYFHVCVDGPVFSACDILLGGKG